jgi:hypothetical protein
VLIFDVILVPHNQDFPQKFSREKKEKINHWKKRDFFSFGLGEDIYPEDLLIFFAEKGYYG